MFGADLLKRSFQFKIKECNILVSQINLGQDFNSTAIDLHVGLRTQIQEKCILIQYHQGM